MVAWTSHGSNPVHQHTQDQPEGLRLPGGSAQKQDMAKASPFALNARDNGNRANGLVPPASGRPKTHASASESEASLNAS